jgi:hypothetical protein
MEGKEGYGFGTKYIDHMSRYSIEVKKDNIVA